MIKTMIKPIFKRFIGLFISMAFVSMLSIGLLCAFASMITNVRSTFDNYVNEYQDVDLQLTFDMPTAKDTVDDYLIVDGSPIKRYDKRFAIDMYLEKENGRKITSRLFSYDEENDTVFNRRILKKAKESYHEGYYDVSVISKFANNNEFKIGSTFKIGFLGIYINCYVSEIVETPEGIYPRSNEYIWSDNRDFGYLYIDVHVLAKGLGDLAFQIEEKCDPENPKYDPNFLPQYQEMIRDIGTLIPDIREFSEENVPTFTNQLLIAGKNNVSEKKLQAFVDERFDDAVVPTYSIIKGSNLPYRMYMENAIKQLKVAAIFLPIFFYLVTMIVIGLFMNQIIKTMTSDIGVMISIGIDKKQIVLLYMMFSLAMTIVAAIFGIGVGYGVNTLLTLNMRVTYSMSFLPIALNPVVVTLAIVALVAFAEVATYLSCLSIFKITPKDALIANESKRKQLPKWLDKMIAKSPMNIKLATNSIAQNPRRFFVSSFSIFASYVLILLSCFFFVSKNEMVSQTVDRRLNYDCQVYLPNKDDEMVSKLRSYTDVVEKAEDGYYTYVPATSKSVKSKVYVECLGIELNNSMVVIPDSTGKGTTKIKEEGIVLPVSIASQLKVNPGDYINVGENTIKVTSTSYQYFHPIAYLYKGELDRITSTYVTSILVNVTDEVEFLDKLSAENVQCLTVFSKSLRKDLTGIFDSINIFLVILIVFALGMSFVILSIMSQNALLESQRQLSVFRAIGFTIGNVSNIWTFTSLLQLIMGSLIAIPAGIGASLLLFNSASSATQIYPFIFDWRVVLFGFAFVLLVVIGCHIISMFKIKRWNLADNLRCRE